MEFEPSDLGRGRGRVAPSAAGSTVSVESEPADSVGSGRRTSLRGANDKRRKRGTREDFLAGVLVEDTLPQLLDRELDVDDRAHSSC